MELIDLNLFLNYRYVPQFLIFTTILLVTTQVQCQVLMNRAPQFIPGQDMSRFSLSENTPVNSPVYQLRGIDPEGGRLRYSISGPVFSVDRDTGVVRLRQELDREQQDIVEVIISITDEPQGNAEPNTVSLRREIPIRDFNDNPPIFLGRPYSATLSESTPVGSIVQISPTVEVIDRDEGVNSDITFSCYVDKSKEGDDTCDVFEVTTEKISDGRYNASIKLIKQLDFESRPSYVLTLLAKDGAKSNPLSAFATISINLIDVQDQPPIFINAPYSITLHENTPAHVSVFEIKAKDGDTGNPRPVLITLEDDVRGHFRLEALNSSDMGHVKLITTEIPLDRELTNILQNGGVYTFHIRATELIDGTLPGDSSITQITVVLLDVDDNLPEFNANFFNVSIPENLEMNTLLPGLSIYVTDLDLGDNSKYDLSLVNIHNSEDMFTVHPKQGEGRTPIVVRVKNPSKLDYDVDDPKLREFVFDIVATSQKNKSASSKARIVINLQDMNDNSPMFEKTSYGLEIAENTDIGTKIADIQATDRDSFKYGKIMYVLRGFGAEYFKTNKDTGGVFVKKMLDYEMQKSYILTLVAIDGGGRESNANLYIEIMDTNDNAPQWEQREYIRTVREGATEFEPQFFVRATDIDGPTQGGGKITYSIESENSISGHVFTIDSHTGEIRISSSAKSMDTERGEYELNVVATDAGTPPLKNETVVRIRVGISGNQRPIFKGHFNAQSDAVIPGPPHYRVSIPENAQFGDNVTKVQAIDPDGIDSMLVYRIVGANDNFVIDENTGIITVSKYANLDRDTNPDSYSVVVNAVDAGIPIPETATTTVYVNIQDVNDKPPKFDKSSYIAYVSEIAPNNTEVIGLKATDTDLHSNLRYTIVEPIKANSKSGIAFRNSAFYKEAFRIDPITGVIYVNNTLNYNEVSSVILTVEVRDLFAAFNVDEQYDRTEVMIYIQAFKNTNPIFKNKGWSPTNPNISFEVNEETSPGTTILRLEAEDPVSQSVITNFELINPDQGGYISINDRTGDISLMKRLDYEALEGNQTSFIFTVKAMVSSGKRFSIANINMTVLNINDHSPEFDKSSYKITILESVKYPESILTIHATDKDVVRNEIDMKMGYNEIVYSLAGTNAPLFTIDNRTGVIQVAKGQVLDREKQSMIKLTGVAKDSYGKVSSAAKTTVSILIELLDVNDNPPKFVQQVFTAVIPETAAINTFVTTIEATDPDDGPGGEIVYDLLNEGDASGLVKMNSKTGEIHTKSSLTGKGRSEPYEIVIRAQDRGNLNPKEQSLYSDTTLLLYVGDISANDGIPFFVAPKIGQVAQVSENATIGSPVFQVIAKDHDNPSTLSGKIRFRIQNDIEDAKSFRIDALTGLVTTVRPLDRETKDKYQIIIEVSDMGEPPQAATRVLVINVMDVDDHKPRFEREIDARPVELEVLEEQPKDTIIGEIFAIDEDINENGAIDYAFIDGNEQGLFAINRTDDNKAVISTKKPLDHETADSYILTVKCFKFDALKQFDYRKPYNPHEKSEIKILIKVLDIDDHLPEFQLKNESNGVHSHIPINTVVTTVKAIDVDSSALPINISIIDVNFVSQFHRKGNKSLIDLVNIFNLNPVNGEIRNTKSLSNYVDGYFELKLRANNSNIPRRYTDTTIKLFVIRDKSLLRFVFAKPPTEITLILPEFTSKVQNILKERDLELSVFDAQVLHKSDHSLDFSATSSCFQLTRHGSVLSPHEMKKIMDSEDVKQALLETYLAFSVEEVESCVGTKLSTAGIGSVSGTWLVILAGIIGIASLLALLSTCCLFRKREPNYNGTPILTPRLVPSDIDIYASQPVLVSNGEPMYGPL
uniref:CSON011722 protein n=1 Tax=Culicoides sonorensis TaxID=179676 RepID=A0A336M3U9_CULSO